MGKKVVVILIWALISVGAQLGFLYYVEKQITGNVQAASPPREVDAPVIVKTTVTIPEAKLRDLQASFKKEYLAYWAANGSIKVFNVKTGKVVFTENKPVKGELLSFTWLPDRNTLLFVSTTQATKTVTSQKPASSSPNAVTVGYKVAANTTEDPLAKTTTPATVKPPVTTTPTPAPAPPPPVKTTVTYMATEIYVVDFASADEDVEPDKKLGSVVDGFPAGATVQSLEASTYTNLFYVLAKTSNAQSVFEIDVMKHVRTVQRSGEKITRMAVSDKKGTLYMQSNVSGVAQIVAVRDSNRVQVLKGSQYVLLGVTSDKLLVGIVVNDELTAIQSLTDIGQKDTPDGKTTDIWTGNIAWKNWESIFVDRDFIAFFDGTKAVILDNGKERSVNFRGPDNFLTADGREVMELTPGSGGTTVVEINPL